MQNRNSRPGLDDEFAASGATRPAVTRDDAVDCPICGARSRFFFAHPDADVHRCPGCTHGFTRLETLRVFETYDAAYHEVHRSWFANPNTPLFRWIEQRLPDDCASVVDVGCGNGDFLKYLHARRPECRLVGVDLSPHEPLAGIELIRGDIASQAIEGSFDVVASLAAIEHVPDVSRFGQRLATLCKPGGIVVVMTLNANGLLYLAARAGRRLGVRIASNRLYSAHHLHHFTPASLRRLLEAVGLRVVATHHHNVPLAALDLPAAGLGRNRVLMAGVAMCFGLGKLSNRCYLQTVICRREG